MQHEMIKGKLLDSNGQLSEPGFAYAPLKSYHRDEIKAPKWRIKEWDYYYIGNLHHGLSITISDLGYISMIGITFFNFKVPVQYSRSFIGFFPMGNIKLPNHPSEGKTHVVNKNYDMTFEVNGDVRHLYGTVKKVHGKDDLSFDLKLEDKNKVGLCIATPFNKVGYFYYNYKLNNLLASGLVTLGNDTYDFEGTQGVLDWGRGVWPYKNTWYWLSFSGNSGEFVVGANLGYGFGDTSAASENIVYERPIDSTAGASATKLEDVVFEIPQDDLGHDCFMGEWVIKSASGDIDLKFKPLLNRSSRSNLLVIKSIQNQVFGYFSGTIMSNGRPLKIDNVVGFAEKVYNAW